ncbi:hypothetical protein IJH01_01530 [Candidatus Saccharibacteria bacterium]|nr:hypothetical protein [Candidatus Saccharibacteria bacterium]
MQLIVILLTTVAVLTFLSGAIVFFGSSKGDRVRSAWFFLAAIFATAWMASISVFMLAQPEWTNNIEWHVKWTFVSAILIDLAFLGYVAWTQKNGKILTFLFVILGIAISTLIFFAPNLLYSDIIISRTGNSVVMNIGPLYFSYIIFFSLIVPAIIFSLFRQSVKTHSLRKKGGDITIMASFGLSSLIILVANLILPLLGNWSAIWLGPLALSATIIGFYYTILRYHSLNLSSVWLKIFSYIVIISSVAIIYMIIFAIIFAALFRGSTPSTEVIILNFIMILIFVALTPAMNEFTRFIRTLISQSDQHRTHTTKHHSSQINSNHSKEVK